MTKIIKTKTVYPHLGIIDEVEEIVEEENEEAENSPSVCRSEKQTSYV